MPLPRFSQNPQQFLPPGRISTFPPAGSRAWALRRQRILRLALRRGLPCRPPAGEEPRQPTPAAPPPHLNPRRRRVRRARREPKMAVCGRVRGLFRLSAALQLLLLATAGAQNNHGQGQGLGSFPGQGGGGSPAGQQPPQQSQLSQQQQQPPPQQQQSLFPAGGLPARRGGAGPGGTGGGWKLAEEESCREDVTRVCPKHTWSNNLAVLECLQDVREVRRWDGPGRRAEPGAGRRVSPAWKPRLPPGFSFPRSFPSEAVLTPLSFLALTLGCVRASGSHPSPSFSSSSFRSPSRCSGIRTSAHGLSRRRPKEHVSVCAPVFCVMLYAEWFLAENQFKIFFFLSVSTSTVCSNGFQREK